MVQPLGKSTDSKESAMSEATTTEVAFDPRWNKYHWGTYGINFAHALTYIPLNDCCNDHLEAIMRDYKDGKQPLSPEYKELIESLLAWRQENGMIL